MYVSVILEKLVWLAATYLKHITFNFICKAFISDRESEQHGCFRVLLRRGNPEIGKFHHMKRLSKKFVSKQYLYLLTLSIKYLIK